METDMDARIVNEFVAGTEVPEIAARYAVPEAYVDRVINETSLAKPRRRWDWSFGSWGNRLMYSAVTAVVVTVATGGSSLGWIVGVVLFVLTSAIVGVRR